MITTKTKQYFLSSRLSLSLSLSVYHAMFYWKVTLMPQTNLYNIFNIDPHEE